MVRGWGNIGQEPVPADVLEALQELNADVVREVNDEVIIHCAAHLNRTGHPDQHPSCSVNTETGYVNCFSCGWRGPFIVVVKELLGCDDDTAIEWIKERGGSIDHARTILHGGKFIEELAEEEITEADLALYVEVPEWAAYEKDLDPEVCDHYGILWDPKREHWIFPIRDPDTGRLWGWQEKAHEGRYFRNYPRSVKKSLTLFGIEQLESTVAVLVESPRDVARLATAGVVCGVSSFGAGVSDAQLNLLVDAGVKILISALDDDSDGTRYNDTLRARCRGRLRLRYWDYGTSGAKDPGDQTDRQIIWSFDNAYSSVRWVKP